jgi:pimeloyl-ACP methyl ester carboxylesterase
MKVMSNGVALNVRDSGSGDIKLVFQHHWGGSSLTWSEVTSRLSDRFRCVAIDARGAGASAAPVAGYSTRDHAADALTVIQSLEVTRYVLVGHSMGGKASQVLASQRPAGLLGVVLVASSPPSPMAIGEAQREQMKKAYSDAHAVEWSLDNVLLGSPIAPEARTQLIADALRLSAEARTGWVDIGSREDFSKEVQDINVPAVILAGQLDRVDPSEVVKAHIIPHYRSAPVHFLPDKGHLLPVEAPREVAAIVAHFASAL